MGKERDNKLAKLREWEENQVIWERRYYKARAALELGADGDGHTVSEGLAEWSARDKISVGMAQLAGTTRPMTLEEEFEIEEEANNNRRN